MGFFHAACATVFLGAIAALAGLADAAPIAIDNQKLSATIDPATCRWSAQLKGTGIGVNNAYFLPSDNPAGWTVTSTADENYSDSLGAFSLVTLHGVKTGQLDFDFRLYVSKTGNDVLVSLGRANNTGAAVKLDVMDYFVSKDARLGGTSDKWVTLGVDGSLDGWPDFPEEYYQLGRVGTFTTPRTYEVFQSVKNIDTDDNLLMGHATAFKGKSRFSVTKGSGAASMAIGGSCAYNITMPAGKSFAGEKLLICLNTDAIRSLEHMGDLIAISHNVQLRKKRPLNLDDQAMVANDYCHFMGWMSGGTSAGAASFFQANGLYDFFYDVGGPYRNSWALYNDGMSYNTGFGPTINYPASCYASGHLDFSNPQTVQLEHDRAFASVVGHETQTGWSHLDFCQRWDVWSGQMDPFMSALETYHAGAAPWRDVVDQKVPRVRNRACLNMTDHSYGYVDILRNSYDADQCWNCGGCDFFQTVKAAPVRFFYNGRVYWIDCDNFHVFKYANGTFTYGQGKVSSHFRAMVGSTLLPSEAFDVTYPADRIELMKRISPMTEDVSYPVDMFVRKPACVWNMPIQRTWGDWSVLTVFSFDFGATFTAQLDMAKDLRLDANKDYLVYEFWTRKFIGTFKGTFSPTVIAPTGEPNCNVYSIVEKLPRPVLISTSRHIRQMAFDIKALSWDGLNRRLSGTSRAVKNDPYQLRIFVPDSFTLKSVELPAGLTSTTSMDGQVLNVNYTTATGNDVAWSVTFNGPLVTSSVLPTARPDGKIAIVNGSGAGRALRYRVERTAPVRIELIDALGRRIAVLCDRVREPGEYLAPLAGPITARGLKAEAVLFIRCAIGDKKPIVAVVPGAGGL